MHRTISPPIDETSNVAVRAYDEYVAGTQHHIDPHGWSGLTSSVPRSTLASISPDVYRLVVKS